METAMNFYLAAAAFAVGFFAGAATDDDRAGGAAFFIALGVLAWGVVWSVAKIVQFAVSAVLS